MAQRREVQRKRAQKAAEVNVLKASDADIGKALDRLDANLKARQADASSARQSAEVAAKSAVRTRKIEERTASRLTGLRSAMRQAAVDAYVRGPSPGLILPLDAGSLSQAATKQYLRDVALGQGTDLADQLRATSQDLAIERAAADEAAQRAETRRKAADQRVGDVKQAVDLKQQVADSVEQRLESALAEADSLTALDSQLATQIAQRQAALAARIAGSRGRGGALPQIGAVNITTVRGISVASPIAQQVEDLLSAAEADGINLSGSGYRNSENQVAARRAHCGSSSYSVYQAPASSCRPPTARPGQSMHERGLAIDFTWNGALITGHNAGYQWLRNNAGHYGLSNLPSEPWHWSTNGN